MSNPIAKHKYFLSNKTICENMELTKTLCQVKNSAEDALNYLRISTSEKLDALKSIDIRISLPAKAAAIASIAFAALPKLVAYAQSYDYDPNLASPENMLNPGNPLSPLSPLNPATQALLNQTAHVQVSDSVDWLLGGIIVGGIVGGTIIGEIILKKWP